MTRGRSPAIDYDAPNPSAEVHSTKGYMYAFSGMYLNFAYNKFVKHADLDKNKIYEFSCGFAEKVAGGKAKGPLIAHLAQYLEPKDFLALHLAAGRKKNIS